MSPKVLRSRPGKIIVAALALALLSAGAWWVSTDRRSDDDALEIPSRVCLERIPGKSVAPLLPAKGPKLEEDTSGFSKPTPGFNGECVLKVGDEEVGVGFTRIPGNKYTRSHVQSRGTPVSLGDAYGTMTDKNRIRLYVPCPSAQYPEDRLIISTNADAAEQADSFSRTTHKLTTADNAYLAFTADVARTLSREWFKCPGAAELQGGPVAVQWNDSQSTGSH